MISFENGTNKFQYRAASIVLHNNKVLLQRQQNDHHWFMPGGRVEFNEAAESTIEREMIEEFSVQIMGKKMIWIVENFVDFQDKQVHEIGFFFLVKLPEHHPIYSHEAEFEGTEEGFVNKWVALDSMDEYTIVPEFVVPGLKSLDLNNGIKHVINRSMR